MIVYRHIRLDKNEVFYIGIGKNLSRAFDKRQRNRYWKFITNKTKYRVDILFDDLSKEEASDKEKEFIKLYGRKDLGLGTLVNMTDGGDGLNNISKELKKRISDKLKNKNCSYFKGKKHTDETKKIMSLNHHRRTECLDTKTGIIYKSIKEVCIIFNIPKTTLLRNMKNVSCRFQKIKR